MKWNTDRLPTAADADQDGHVIVQAEQRDEPPDGVYFDWQLVRDGMAWLPGKWWEAPVAEPDPEPEPAPAPKPALAVGQRWRRRDGAMVTIEHYNPNVSTTCPFGADKFVYAPDGTAPGAPDADLVELIEPAAEPEPRRFMSISRTILSDGDHILDAIDNEGVAWWMRLDTHPHHPAFPPRDPEWHRLSPLPARELPAEPEF